MCVCGRALKEMFPLSVLLLQEIWSNFERVNYSFVFKLPNFTIIHNSLRVDESMSASGARCVLCGGGGFRAPTPLSIVFTEYAAD